MVPGPGPMPNGGMSQFFPSSGGPWPGKQGFPVQHGVRRSHKMHLTKVEMALKSRDHKGAHFHSLFSVASTLESPPTNSEARVGARTWHG